MQHTVVATQLNARKGSTTHTGTHVVQNSYSGHNIHSGAQHIHGTETFGYLNFNHDFSINFV